MQTEAQPAIHYYITTNSQNICKKKHIKGLIYMQSCVDDNSETETASHIINPLLRLHLLLISLQFHEQCFIWNERNLRSLSHPAVIYSLPSPSASVMNFFALLHLACHQHISTRRPSVSIFTAFACQCRPNKWRNLMKCVISMPGAGFVFSLWVFGIVTADTASSQVSLWSVSVRIKNT